MSDREGVVKFLCHHIPGPPPRGTAIDELLVWRDRLRVEGLVGIDRDGIGYGNVSVRTSLGFVITGTQTGPIQRLGPDGLTEVTSFEIDANSLVCQGPVPASSESLTHAAVYSAAPEAMAVVHVHDAQRWWHLVGRAPTTDRHVAYGTPAMAHEIARLIRSGATAVERLVVMAGHVDGLISYGETLEEAARRLIAR